jgi:hypothetical protein
MKSRKTLKGQAAIAALGRIETLHTRADGPWKSLCGECLLVYPCPTVTIARAALGKDKEENNGN